MRCAPKSGLLPTHSEHVAELVCSNSFGAQATDRASGLLHEELRQLGSVVIAKANQHQVPAGGALAVDRGVFSQDLTATLERHPLVELRREEVLQIPTVGIVVLTTGPLTSEALSTDLQRFTGAGLHELFSTPPAPLWWADTIDRNVAFYGLPLRPGGSGLPELPHEP